jgi:hypothetical protein
MIDAVIRITPHLSPSKPPEWFKDKFELTKVCLASFIGAGKSNKTFLLDDCPKEYASYFRKFGNIHEGVWGKKVSLYKAYEYAQKNYTGNILFLEDDYLWRPHTLDIVEQGLMAFGFVSPYDHVGNYGDGIAKTIVVGNTTWRLCSDNTHTFAVRSDIFQKNIEDFYYGLHDWQMYHKLAEHGIKGYTPMYSIATHLVDGLLAYNTQWVDIAEWYKKTL